MALRFQRRTIPGQNRSTAPKHEKRVFHTLFYFVYILFKTCSTRPPGYDDIFIITKHRRNFVVKNFIIKNNLIEYKCDICKQLPMWNGKILTLHLDHKNGNKGDNRIKNLKFLCPNCHEQTDTMRGRKINERKQGE